MIRRLEAFSTLDWPPLDILRGGAAGYELPPVQALACPSQGRIEDVCVYIDPPYQATAGYYHTLPREEVVAVATKWSSLGAQVAVSESEPLEIPGFGHTLDITRAQTGRSRRYHPKKGEWLTLNFPPKIKGHTSLTWL